jgi:hypothetical protein
MLGHLEWFVTIRISTFMESHRKMTAKMLLQLRVFLEIFVTSNHWTAYLYIIDRLLKALIAPQQSRLVHLRQVRINLCLKRFLILVKQVSFTLLNDKLNSVDILVLDVVLIKLTKHRCVKGLVLDFDLLFFFFEWWLELFNLAEE